jgi:hypothetical protein
MITNTMMINSSSASSLQQMQQQLLQLLLIPQRSHIREAQRHPEGGTTVLVRILSKEQETPAGPRLRQSEM